MIAPGTVILTDPATQAATLASITEAVRHDVQPASVLETILAEQIVHARWELQRVRRHRNHQAAEARLVATSNRAQRNVNRAWKAIIACKEVL